jgi:hypothetical protein
MKYRTTAAVTISSGVIGLTAAQAASRKEYLAAVKGGRANSGLYEITGSIQFKKGEVIDLAKPGKELLTKLEKT